jgi:hypothetical protein
VAHATEAFRLASPLPGDDSGLTQEAHLRQVAFSLGQDPDEEIAKRKPPLPDVAQHAWAIFLELNSERDQSMNGPKRITLKQLGSYEEFYRVELSPATITLVRACDTAWFNVYKEMNASGSS